MKKVILITGSSSGLGKFLAESLAKEGFVVYAGMRDALIISDSNKLWSQAELPIHAVQVDVTKEDSIRAAVSFISKKSKRIDVLINNAGYTISGPSTREKVEVFQKLLDTNLLGAFRMMQAVYPIMQRQGGGKIINITSLNGLLALPNFALYSASKFALEALSSGMKYELQKENIWITALAPGAIQSNDVKPGKPLLHKPAREKFFLLKLLMPMVTPKSILQKINGIIKSPNPSGSVIIGADAHITLLLQRFLPNFLWERLLFFIWNT